MAEAWEMTSGRERRYSIPAVANNSSGGSYREVARETNTAEDLHAWSIYRQNLNSDFANSALGTKTKAPLPYGNFQLDSNTIHSIMTHPKCGPKSGLAHNTSAYLKFGLPRVSNSKKFEESSGYDSSNDGSPVLRSKNPLSRSDPDFRKLIHNPAGADRSGREKRLKSVSEANLLASTSKSDGYRQRPDPTSNSRPASQQSKHSKMGSHISYHSRQQQQQQQQQQQRSRAFTNLSVFPQRDEAMLNSKYFPRDEYFRHHSWEQEDNNERVPVNEMKQRPHLQVRGLCYHYRRSPSDSLHLLDNISIEARPGDILGILATTQREGTALLDILANRHQRRGFKVRGDLVLNGLTTSSADLSERLAYVQRDCNLCGDMTVRQTLLFTALLQAPGRPNRNIDTKGRIGALIHDLGLGPVRHSRVSTLTVSERRRLNVACHLLLDADVVLLDQPTQGMDIFDTFFLVEYLRQWAERGRIVILTIHPPTYEVFTMLSRVALISSGRLMYSGRRREMLPYFAFIEFPCPAYKNPSDYYLDLVTLDDLTAEALLESSQRAEHLAETFRRRQEPLSDPGPPGTLPPKNKRANPCLQFAALWIRAMAFSFPANLQRWLSIFMTTTLMSIILGSIFWQVRSDQSEQEDVNDRLAMHYVVGVVGVWPTLMLIITQVWNEKDSVARDINDQLYGRLVYFFSEMSYSFVGAAGIFLAYLVPIYTLAGFHSTENVAIEIGYMMLYLFAVRAMAVAFSQLFSSRHYATAACGLVLSLVALSSGFVVQVQTMNLWTLPIRWASPLYWTLDSLKHLEFTNLTSIECNRNPLTRQEAPGLVLKIPCGVSNGAQALTYWAHNYEQLADFYPPILLVMAFWAFFVLVQSVALSFRTSVRKQSRHKRPLL